MLINPKDWSWDWWPFTLPQLIRKTVKDPADMVATEYHHTIYEIEGNIQELAAVENSELLDKKVVRRTIEASLVLDKEMTLEDELVEYLTYILELPEDKIFDILGTYNDYAQTTQLG